MSKQTKITLIAVIISIVLSVVAFMTVRSNSAASRSIGGEGLLLLLPLLTYITCKNITLSFEVFRESKEDDELDDYETRIISEPRKLDEALPSMEISWGSHSTHAEDFSR